MSASQVPESGDRYVSFRNIDFDGNMKAVLEHLMRHVDDPEKNNALWDRFRQRLSDAASGANAGTDALLLLHSHVYYIRELFEEYEDEEALAALAKLEEECF